MVDLILTIAHHCAVFSLVGIFAAELALVRPGLDGRRLKQLAQVDLAFGAIAGLVLVVGILRVIYGASGADYYLSNWVFWLKMGAFVIVGLISIGPTVSIIKWRRQLEADNTFVPTEGAIAAMRRFLFAEALVLILIPAFAAVMARGYGV
jgi:putative membrane protein